MYIRTHTLFSTVEEFSTETPPSPPDYFTPDLGPSFADKRGPDLRAEILIKIPLPHNRSHASHIRTCPARVCPLSA